jgi:hypothetical protein
MQVLRLPFPFDKLRVRVAQDDNRIFTLRMTTAKEAPAYSPRPYGTG